MSIANPIPDPTYFIIHDLLTAVTYGLAQLIRGMAMHSSVTVDNDQNHISFMM